MNAMNIEFVTKTSFQVKTTTGLFILKFLIFLFYFGNKDDNFACY